MSMRTRTVGAGGVAAQWAARQLRQRRRFVGSTAADAVAHRPQISLWTWPALSSIPQ